MGSHTLSLPPSLPAEESPLAGARAALDPIRRLVQALRVSSREAEKRWGLSGAQLFVLRNLAEGGEAVSLNELASRTLTHQSSVSVVISRLVRRGFVTRTASKEDSRRLHLKVSAKGRAFLRQAEPTGQERLIAAISGLDPGSRTELARLLSLVIERAGFSAEEPQLFFEEDER